MILTNACRFQLLLKSYHEQNTVYRLKFALFFVSLTLAMAEVIYQQLLLR